MNDSIFTLDFVRRFRHKLSRGFLPQHKFVASTVRNLVGGIRLTEAELSSQKHRVVRFVRLGHFPGIGITCFNSNGTLMSGTFFLMKVSSEARSIGWRTAPAMMDGETVWLFQEAWKKPKFEYRIICFTCSDHGVSAFFCQCCT